MSRSTDSLPAQRQPGGPGGLWQRICRLGRRCAQQIGLGPADPGDIGRRGEKLARRFLKARGFRVITRNYRCPAGEIDLIILDGRTVAFVEVKSRRGLAHADPEDTVTVHKRRQVTRVAQVWLSRHPADDRTWRFDVVAVTFVDTGKPIIRYTPDAFPPER
jgi:putative endonuclease